MQSDAELLREFAANKSEAAFGEIVRRYADLVYSAALRQVGETEQARDVAQTVFADLARKAGGLRESTLLVGWLYRGARLAALEQLRKDRRRQQRERQAMEFFDPSSENPSEWNAVQPFLDEAMASLGNEDRDALLLRFFKNESLASVGATLGVSEDAAQKRVSRALGKLREFLAQRGINTTAAALSAVLITNAVQAAPAGFAVSLTAAALAKAAAGSSVILKLFTLTTMKTTVLLLALAGGIAALTVLELNTKHELRDARTLMQQQADELAALRAANEQLASQTNRADVEQLRSDAQDVLRLRGQIAQLRREQTENAEKAAVVQALRRAQTNSLPKAQEQQIQITAKFVTAPPGYFTSGLSEAPTNETAEVRILSSPRVLTFNGGQAGLSSTRSVPYGLTSTGVVYTNVGVSLDVTPFSSTNSSRITLNLIAGLQQLVDASPQQDASLPTLRRLTMTNSINVADGETTLLQMQIPNDGQLLEYEATNTPAGPRTLTVFVTPKLVTNTNAFTQRLQSVIRRVSPEQ